MKRIAISLLIGVSALSLGAVSVFAIVQDATETRATINVDVPIKNPVDEFVFDGAYATHPNYMDDTHFVASRGNDFVLTGWDNADSMSGASYLAIPYAFEVSYTGNPITSLTVTDVYFAYYYTQAGLNYVMDALDSSPLGGYALYHPVNDAVYVYQYGMPFVVSDFQADRALSSSNYSLPTQSVYFGYPSTRLSGYAYLQYVSASGYPKVWLDGDAVCDYFEPFALAFAGARSRLSDNYGTEYNMGYEVGYKSGHEVGYREGYSARDSLISPRAQVILDLFGSVTSVPIEVLNGFNAFTIWDVGLISIAFTFFSITAIIWLVKKFI